MKHLQISKLLSDPKLYLLLFFLNFLIFTILLFKNPFSERNLISNLEPYPDSIHYLSPALSFIHGKGFYIEREDRIFKSTVPFLYSLVLTPGFLLYDDVRFFYITNVVLALSGFVFFYFFLTRISGNKLIPPLLGFIYVTNYFIYWFPNLPMAENLGLSLFNAGLFLLTTKISSKSAVLIGIIAVSFYAAKYANFTLSVALVFVYLLKIYSSGNWSIDKTQLLKNHKLGLTLILSSVLSLAVFFAVEYLIRGDSIFLKIQYLIQPLITPPDQAVILKKTNPWFSYSYFSANFPVYLSALLGNQVRFLWDFTPLLPKYLSILAIIGLFFGLLIKKHRQIALSLVLFILSPILFLSTFYTADARYIYHVIPCLIAGLAILLSYFSFYFSNLRKSYLFYIVLVVLFCTYLLLSFQRLKLQALLNLKYAETPWNYLAVKNFNQYFSDTKDVKSVLITAMPPYYIDFFSESRYKLLPLSTEQEFSNNLKLVWGDEDYQNFIELYKKYLNDGFNVYVTNAALGNQTYLHRDFELIKQNFDLLKVNVGCVETCNIYKLKTKHETAQ